VSHAVEEILGVDRRKIERLFLLQDNILIDSLTSGGQTIKIAPLIEEVK